MRLECQGVSIGSHPVKVVVQQPQEKTKANYGGRCKVEQFHRRQMLQTLTNVY